MGPKMASSKGNVDSSFSWVPVTTTLELHLCCPPFSIGTGRTSLTSTKSRSSSSPETLLILFSHLSCPHLEMSTITKPHPIQQSSIFSCPLVCLSEHVQVTFCGLSQKTRREIIHCCQTISDEVLLHTPQDIHKNILNCIVCVINHICQTETILN